MAKTFNFSGLNDKSTPPAGARTVRVSSKSMAQIERVGGDKGLRQACVILGGPALNSEKPVLKVGGEEYTVIKKKGGCIWAVHQTEETIEAFGKLYNKLAKTPDKEITVE